MEQEISLIGANMGWGAFHHEAALGPQKLIQGALVDKLGENHSLSWQTCSPPTAFVKGMTLDYQHRLSEVQAFSATLSDAVLQSEKESRFPIVLGGDHSIAVGTWSALTAIEQRAKQFGLIWMDAHMDAHTPDTTPSHAIHGMPLAALLGHGAPSLVDHLFKGPKLSPEHVVLIGVRSYEAEEAALLRHLGVKIYFMEEVNKRGFSTVFMEAIEKVTHATSGFGISLDLDAFDPSVAPGTGTPVKGGLMKDDVLQAFEVFPKDKLKAFEIAEFDPTRDIENKTLKLVEAVLRAIMTREK